MYFNNHWVETLGHLKMTQIDPVVLNRWLELKRRDGLSDGYLARMQGVLSGLFELAVETNAMGTNPMRKQPQGLKFQSLTVTHIQLRKSEQSLNL